MAEIKISDLTAKGANLASTDLFAIAESDGAGGYDSKYITGAEISAISSESIYTTDGTIGTSRTAELTDSLTYRLGQIIRSTNSRVIKEVTQASELPTTLITNTTYVIRGQITISSNITCNVEGVEIIGIDRNEDEIVWSGTGAFLTLTDCNIGINGVKFSSSTSGNSILSATNVTGSGYNDGRDKIISILNCQFRGCYDVLDINGFDLVDINNSLFFYIQATNFGLRFQDVSKLQITSCELIRWFDESTLPTPSGYATVSMIELQADSLSSFGAVNINGCVIHPQQTQTGVYIDSSSTTGFGTIAANTFVSNGLTSGELFYPTVSAGVPDYSQTETYNFDVFTNQGLKNSNAYVLGTMTGNATDTALTVNTPAQIDTGNNNAQTSRQRWSASSGGQFTYLGTKDIFVSIMVRMTLDKQGGGTASYTFYIYKNGVQVSESATTTTGLTTNDTLTMVYAMDIETTDYIQIWVENTTDGDDMLITDWQVLIKE